MFTSGLMAVFPSTLFIQWQPVCITQHLFIRHQFHVVHVITHETRALYLRSHSFLFVPVYRERLASTGREVWQEKT